MAMIIHRIHPTIVVHTPIGTGKAIFLIEYGQDVNSVWKVRMDATGRPVNFYEDDILIYGNPMDEEHLIRQIPKEWKK